MKKSKFSEILVVKNNMNTFQFKRLPTLSNLIFSNSFLFQAALGQARKEILPNSIL